MKMILFIGVLSISLSCYSQEDRFRFPNIANLANKVVDFIPNGWELVDSVYRNFNKDSLMDFAMVIRTKIATKPNDTSCVSSELYHPKMLIIVFQKPDKTFNLSITATKFFGDCNWGIQGTDPYDKIYARRNTLVVQLSTGGTERNIISYFLKYLDNNWYLIGASSESYQQGQPGFYIEDINFVTRVKKSYSKNSLKGKKIFPTKEILVNISLIKLSDFVGDFQIPFTPEN